MLGDFAVELQPDVGTAVPCRVSDLQTEWLGKMAQNSTSGNTVDRFNTAGGKDASSELTR